MARTYADFFKSLTEEQWEEWARAGDIWNRKYEPHMYTCCVCLERADRRDQHPCVCECEGPHASTGREGRDDAE